MSVSSASPMSDLDGGNDIFPPYARYIVALEIPRSDIKKFVFIGKTCHSLGVPLHQGV